MKRKGRNVYLLLLLAIIIGIFYIEPSGNLLAKVPYETYTYDIFGTYFVSPDAYVTAGMIDAKELGISDKNFHLPNDMVCDTEGNIYLADTGNDRIIIMNAQYELVNIISEFQNDRGDVESFLQPMGIAVRENELYIADSKNARIVVLGKDGKFIRIIGAPSSEILPEAFIYEPSALAIDPAGRIYVISKSTNMGVIVLSASGAFEGFSGAEKVNQNLTEFFWKLITTREQKQRSRKNVPTEYNNITIDEKGFIYVTTSAINAENQKNAMLANDGTSLNAPIKKLNPAGMDVLRRNGKFTPGGDIIKGNKVSRFIDVALAEDGVYSVLDSTGNKIFTYDVNGNLLYAFGGYGTQTGVFRTPVSICYQGTKLLVLDSNMGMITILERTHYGDSLALALKLQSERKYKESAEQWKYVLTLNAAFDQAYSGVASSYMRLENYKEAKNYYRMAGNIDGYDKAYAEYRKEILSKYFILIPLSILLIIFFLVKIQKSIHKVNSYGWKIKGRRSTKEELCYAFHILFRPFDGFYDLKYENRGGIRGASIILGLALLHHLYRQGGMGFLFTGSDWSRVSFIRAVLTIGLPFLLFVISNWAFTTLMDGKGTMKDIYVAVCYSLLPMALFGILATLLSNVVTANEIQFITFFNLLGNGWTLFLIFFGVLVTNQYTLTKNIITTVCSVAGMGFIAFMGILSINVLQKMMDFGISIINEISFRI